MSDFQKRIENLSPKRLMLLAIELQSRVEKMERQQTEPIAVIGLSCRIPGGEEGPDAFWQLLEEGRNSIREVPSDRWDAEAYYDVNIDAPGRMSTKWGGFLSHIDEFDAQFFGIAGREANGMDPQHRMLLEVCWEALEHAGHSPRKLANTATGVFLGICASDYQTMLLASGEVAIDGYLASGTAPSIAAGRISYTLGLHGPSIAIDTACSASLVAIHLACQSLRIRECSMALAGGVNAILSPTTTIALSKAHMMSSDGRCKTFDAGADGFVRGEGCGMVVLKRLSEAQSDGDHVLAVIRG
ncbi:MAG: polyketide synthase, partial [Terracidiphilus sp.]